MPVDTGTFLAVTGIYVVLTLAVGYLGYRRTKGAEDYMLAGRRAGPWILALSYGATFISTSAIIGFGGVAAVYGMGLVWLTVLNIGMGILVAFLVFGKRTREIGKRLGAVTFPDLMGRRFSDGFMQYASAAVIILGMPLYTSAILIGGARFLEKTIPMPFGWAVIVLGLVTAVYVVAGGLIAVMYTNSLHAIVMFIGMAILLVFTYSLLGGVAAAHEALTGLAPLIPADLQAQGLTGWTTLPALGSPIWYTLVTTLILGVGIGALAQPQLVVRFMTAKDSRTLDRAVLVGGPFILMMTGVTFTVGALSNVFFYRDTGQIAMAAVAGGNLDLVIPSFIDLATPPWFVVLFLITLLAASMSTLSSLFHVMGTAVGFDIWQHFGGRRPSLRANQVGILAMILVSVLLAFTLPGSIVARTTAMFFGLCASALLPSFAYALYSEAPSARAARASLVTGAAAWFLWTAFVHRAESAPLGIARLLTGSEAILGLPWQTLDPLMIALPLSVLALGAVAVVERRRGPATPVPGGKPTWR
ncbi:MAG TPA: sodium:solute symporter family protein [Methanomicrobiales archaeon]|nr:sodium:solute symporter family protein [Methanomicrobiales archaeon]